MRRKEAGSCPPSAARRARGTYVAGAGRRGLLLAAILADLEASPFEGDGYRKVWARPRVQQGIRVSRTRVRVFTLEDGRGWIFPAVDHWNAECVG